MKLYGQEVKLFKLGRLPAQMLIDKEGWVRFVHYGHSMTDIPQNEEILNLIETRLQGNATDSGDRHRAQTDGPY